MGEYEKTSDGELVSIFQNNSAFKDGSAEMAAFKNPALGTKQTFKYGGLKWMSESPTPLPI